jgi:hypothetical protein
LHTLIGLAPTAASPDHFSLTVMRKRLPKDLIEQVLALS